VKIFHDEVRDVISSDRQAHSHSTAMSQEERDGIVASGMESGWRQSVEALGKLA
jgi:hypothetical protein